MRVIHTDDVTGAELIEVGDHEIQFGGDNGDGYCYIHQIGSHDHPLQLARPL